MNTAQHQKLGWIGGWLGGFVWVAILAVVYFADGSTDHGAAGLAVFALAVLTILLTAPWRHPQTPYRALMLPIYLMFVIAVGWAVWAIDDHEGFGIHLPWGALILLPVLLPLWTAGDQRWSDHTLERPLDRR